MMSPLHFILSIAVGATVSSLTPLKNYQYKMVNFDDDFDTKPNETVCIMTRDNVCLATDIYYPISGNKPWTTIYVATPYGKSTIDGLASGWLQDGGYVVLGQDFRGNGASNGTYSFWRTAGNDTLDTVSWMLQQEWSNGYMNVQGGSALALDQYADITGVTQAIWNGEGMAGFNKYNELMNHILFGFLSVGDGLGRNTVYQNGAYRECLIDGWLGLLGEREMIEEVRAHEAFSEWWYPLSGNWTDWDPNGPYDHEPQWEVANLTVVHHAGWYDIFGNNQIETCFGVNETGQINARGNQILIVEPNGHCEGGEILWNNHSYGGQQAYYYSHIIAKAVVEAQQENQLFNVHDYVPFNVLFYMLGPGKLSVESKGNYWVQGESFPPFEPKSFYLNSNGQLTDVEGTKDENLTFTYHPKRPMQSFGGNNLVCQPCGPWNQNIIENHRDDILHFTTDTLVSDIYLVGKIIVELYVSSNCTDTDFTAKLLDIYPDGVGDDDVHMLVQDGIQRMRWRGSEYLTKPEWMKPGEIYEIEIDIGYMSYIFNKGHKMSLSISSSNHERFSINYNSGNLVIDGDKDWKIANNTVHIGSVYPSRLILPVVEESWIIERQVKF